MEIVTMRPTSYNEQVIEDAKNYLENFEEFGDVVPTLEGLAKNIGRASSTVYKWADEDDKEEFSEIVKEVRAYQKHALINSGLSGSFNPMITKLMLCKHGINDKQELDHTSSDGSMTPPAPTYKIVDE